MKLDCKWNGKMRFVADSGTHQAAMDAGAPLGDDTALTPKQLMVAGIMGCTGMDVVSLLRKFRQSPESFEIQADATPTEGGHPVVYSEIALRFVLKGAIEPEKALEAVRLSQTRFCGVSAMVSKAVPIRYTVELNGQLIGSGEADFGGGAR